MKSLLLPIALVLACQPAPSANAAITVSNFSLTSNTITFHITGTLPTAPDFNSGFIFITNPDFMESPGFVLTGGTGVSSVSNSWSGTQAVPVTYPVFTQAPALGDYLGFRFVNPLATGEAISGTLSATFPDGSFDPAAVSTLNFVWGGLVSNQFSDGVLLTSVSVPEPGTTTLACTLALLAVRRRARRP